MSNLKVSVLMTAYNHEDFVQQAVRGVLDQQTDFDVELVVGEDCSTDRTRERLIALADQNPGRIRLILQEKNLGIIQNFAAVFHQCDGDYVALLCGDDYWDDPTKLQQQVDLLQANPDCVMCHTNVRRIWPENPEGELVWPPDKPKRTSMAEMLSTNVIVTSSNMFRGGIIKQLPEWFYECPYADWPLQLQLVQHGDALYIDKPMCVYRLHDGSWSRQTAAKVARGRIEMAAIVGAHLPPQHQPAINQSIKNFRVDLIDIMLQEGEADNAQAYAREHQCLSAYKRLNHFYRGVEFSENGRRLAGLVELVKSSCHGWGETRIGRQDIAIATARSFSPRIYAAARNFFRRTKT